MLSERKDVHLEVKVRNNNILTYMKEAGIKNIATLSRMTRCSTTTLHKLVNMQMSARKDDDQWREPVMTLSEFFGCLPEDLFSNEQQYSKLETNRASAEVAFHEMYILTNSVLEQSSPDLALCAKEIGSIVDTALRGALSPREERIIRMRFGFSPKGCMTLQEIADEFGLSRDRIRQLESRALRSLKHPAYSRGLRVALESGLSFKGDLPAFATLQS